MLKLKIIDISNKEEWQEIADDTVEIYDKWQYVSAYYKNGEGMPHMAYLKGKSGIIYYVYMKRNIKQDKHFKEITIDEEIYDIISPYGYGGVKIKGIISNQEKEEFFKKFEEYCKNSNIVSDFVRLDPLEDNYLNYSNSNYDIEKISKTVYMKLENEEQIWQDLKSACRNMIRKANKNGVIVKSGFNSRMMEEFINIYEQTMQRLDADEYYYFKNCYYADMEKNMQNYATIYTAYLKEKAINSILVIYSGNNAHYHLSGTLSDYKNLGANNLTLYTAAIDMQKKGYKRFHLGGGYGGAQSPLLAFKKSFNKNDDLDFYIGKKIYCEDIYNNLCNIRGIERTSTFFPLYRCENKK